MLFFKKTLKIFSYSFLFVFLLINSIQANGARPTHLATAASKGYSEVVSVLLKYTENINAQDEDGNTALMAAIQGNDSDNHAAMNIEKNRIDIIHQLLTKNPDLNIKNKDGYTALILSTELSDKTIPEVILAKKPIDSWTLIEAAISGRTDIVKKFLNKSSHHKNHDEINQALLFSSSMGHKNIISLLLKKGANINSVDKYGFTPLVRAIYANHRDIVSYLLAHKSDVNIPDKFPEDTPLMAAALFGDTYIMSQLITHGADVNGENKQRDTALTYAIYNNHKGAISLLLKHKANANAEGREGNTPLRSAVTYGDKEMVTLLLENGAEINPKNSYVSETVLGVAVDKNKIDIVELLLEAGAEIKVPEFI